MRRRTTVTELLAVMVIIAILAAVLLTWMSKVRDKALSISRISDVRCFGVAEFKDAEEHGGWPVPVALQAGMSCFLCDMLPLQAHYWDRAEDWSNISHAYHGEELRLASGEDENLCRIPKDGNREDRGIRLSMRELPEMLPGTEAVRQFDGFWGGFPSSNGIADFTLELLPCGT